MVCYSDEVWGEMPLSASNAPFTSMLHLLPPTGAAASGRPEGAGVAGLRERLMLLISPSKCFNVASLDLAVGPTPGRRLTRLSSRCDCIRLASSVTVTAYDSPLQCSAPPSPCHPPHPALLAPPSLSP